MSSQIIALAPRIAGIASVETRDQFRIGEIITPAISPVNAVVLLAGTVRESPLAAAARRPVLELPIRDGYRIIDEWVDETQSLRDHFAVPELPVRLLLHPNSEVPSIVSDTRRGGTPATVGASKLRMSVELDQATYRGTGGTLRDLAAGYEDDAMLLVLNSQQVLTLPLKQIVSKLLDRPGDVTLLIELDDTPSGVMLVRAGSLRCLPAQGYVDFKEQGLPLIGRKHKIVAVRSTRQTGFPVRCAKSYLEALRAYHLRAKGLQYPPDPFEECWASSFAIVEPGAKVDPNVELYDTVVLAGGVVNAGARVARSVVCPGGLVRRGQRCTNMLLRPGRRLVESGAPAGL
jgi:hypothetical protein